MTKAPPDGGALVFVNQWAGVWNSRNRNLSNFILPSQKPNPSLRYVLFLVVLLEYNLHISNHLWLFCRLLSDILQFDNHFQQMVPNLLNYNLLLRIHTCTSSILLINSIYSAYSSLSICYFILTYSQDKCKYRLGREISRGCTIDYSRKYSANVRTGEIPPSSSRFISSRRNTIIRSAVSSPLGRSPRKNSRTEP